MDRDIDKLYIENIKLRDMIKDLENKIKSNNFKSNNFKKYTADLLEYVLVSIWIGIWFSLLLLPFIIMYCL